MATGKAKLTALTQLGLAVETVLGTPVAPTVWVPVQPPKPQDVLNYVDDQGLRGVPFSTFGKYLSTKNSTGQIDGMLYPGSGGNALAAIFGLDTVSGSSSPYTHAFTVADVPPSYTVTDAYLPQATIGRQWPGMRAEKLVLKFTPKGGVSYTESFIGFPSATYTPSAGTYTTEDFFLGYQGAVSFAGTADANLSSFQLTLQRLKSEALFSAADTQTPYDIFIGEMKATVDMQFYMTDETEYVRALSQATVASVVTITQPGTSFVLTVTMSALQFTKPTINRHGKYVICQLAGEAVFNSTDSGALQCTLANGVQTSYSTTAAA